MHVSGEKESERPVEQSRIQGNMTKFMNGVPSYEIKDASGNLQVAHHNWLFLLATPQGEVIPLNKNEDANPGMSTWSALVELTPLECENDLPKDLLEGCQTQHLASRVPLGWVDGVL